MKLKTKPGDFRVNERLVEDYLQERGAHHVYLVQKRKMTSIEAAEVLASLANVRPSDVSMAGLKDRQGVTTQYMSLPGGRRVDLERPELKIRAVGSAQEPLTAEHSLGNEFEIRLRELTPEERVALERNKPIVSKLGVPNYFDEQRFGNLRHGQGWVAKELMLGRHELALKNLLCAESPYDAGALGAFKSALRDAWGDWPECREIAGRFGEHHSIFEHLRNEPGDFKGAFYHVSSRLRLIHLYAFQSHIWNRALALYLARLSGEKGARVADSIEGPLVFPDRFLEEVAQWKSSLRLPGPGLEDVEQPEQRALFEEVLVLEGLTPEQFRIEGVSGFQLKGEERRMFTKPEKLHVVADKRSEARDSFLLSFELPRGAYATLVIRGLLAELLKGPIDLQRLQEARARHASPQRSRRWEGANVPPPTIEGQHSARSGKPAGRRHDRGDKPGWKPREERGERRSYGRREDGAEHRGHGRSEQRGGKPAWKPREERSDRPAWKGREERGARPSYGRGEQRGERPGWKGREERGESKSYGRRDERGGQRGYGGGEQRGGKPAWKPREERGDRPAWKGAGERGARPSYGRGEQRGERSAWKGREERGGRPSYGRRDERGEQRGEQRGGKPAWKQREERGDRPAWKGREERGDRPAWKGGAERGARPSYGRGEHRGDHRGEQRGERPAWKGREERGGRPSYGRRDERGEQRGYGGGEQRGGKPAWKQREERGDRPAWKGREERGDKPAWKGREERGARPSYGRGENRGERPAWKGREERGERRTYGGGKPAWKGREERGGHGGREGGGQRGSYGAGQRGSYGGGQRSGSGSPWKTREESSARPSKWGQRPAQRGAAGSPYGRKPRPEGAGEGRESSEE